MSDIKKIKELALYAAKKQVPTEFANKTVEDVNDVLRAELKELCGTYQLYRKNKNVLFEIMEETMNEVVPKEVISIVGQFAEIRNYPHGAKPEFKVKKGKLRARKFATRATASGVYEAFRLDTDIVPVTTFVIGDAAYIDFERFLAGIEDWADYMEALTDGIVTKIWNEVYEALIAAAGTVVTDANSTISGGTAYDSDELLKIIRKVSAYGSPVIVATASFVDDMGPDAIYAPGLTNWKTGNGVAYAPDDIDAIHGTGFIRIFRGTPVIVLPVSFTDVDNKTEIFDGKRAFILPSDGEKVIKVAMEGGMIVRDWDNRDNSMEIQAYTKIGTAVLTGNNWGYYSLENN